MSALGSPPSSPPRNNNTSTPSSEIRPLIARSTNTTNKKNDDTESSITALTLRVKCNSPGVDPSSNPTGDYEVAIHSSASVLSLKDLVRNAIGQSARGRYLRIIAKGRLLAPDVAPLSNFKVRDGDCVHVVLAAAGVRGGLQAAMARGITPSSHSRSSRMNRGVGISATGLVLPPPSDGSDDDLEAGTERMGFDRLRSTGLTRDEISAIRLYFSRQVDRFIEERERQHNENDDDDNNNENSENRSNEESDGSNQAEVARLRRLQMEDDWMETQGPTSEFRLNLNTNNPLLMNRSFLFAQDDAFGAATARSYVGTDRDFVWGFILGFFVGFIMLFWVWMPTVPHKQKLGILTGISFQLAMSLLKTAGDAGQNDMV